MSKKTKALKKEIRQRKAKITKHLDKLQKAVKALRKG